jgi:hypothetical protein
LFHKLLGNAPQGFLEGRSSVGNGHPSVMQQIQ